MALIDLDTPPSGEGGRFVDLEAPPTKPAPVQGGLLDLAGDVLTGIRNIPLQTRATMEASVSGTDPVAMARSPVQRELLEENARQALEPDKEYVLGLTSEKLKAGLASIPFSLGSMAAYLAASLPLRAAGAAVGGAIAGPPGAVVGGAVAGHGAGMAASAKAGYNMDVGQVLAQLYQVSNTEFKRQYGRDLTPEEFGKFAEQPEIKSELFKHGAAEAGFEALGNFITSTAFGRYLAPVLGAFGKKAATETVGEVAKKATGWGLAKAGGIALAGELATETPTQLVQKQAEVGLGLEKGPAPSLLSGKDWAEAFKEIAWPTAITTGVVGGAAKVGSIALTRYDNAVVAKKISEFANSGVIGSLDDTQLKILADRIAEIEAARPKDEMFALAASAVKMEVSKRAVLAAKTGEEAAALAAQITAGVKVDTEKLLAESVTQQQALAADEGATETERIRADHALKQAELVHASREVGEVVRTADGRYFAKNAGGDSVPLQLWTEDSVRAPGTFVVTPESALALREQYAARGTKVVFYEDNAALPDGAYDPAQPNILFLSSNPSRNLAEVAGHEFKHSMETQVLPDGTTAGDLLIQTIQKGITDEGLRYAFERFTSTAPESPGAGATPEAYAAHERAVSRHIFNELGADIAGEAPKFESFMPRVLAAIEAKYGDKVAGQVLKSFLEAIRKTIMIVRKMFENDTTQSQKWVSNLEEVHGVLAGMHATAYGGRLVADQAKLEREEQAAREEKLKAEQKTTVETQRLISEGTLAERVNRQIAVNLAARGNELAAERERVLEEGRAQTVEKETVKLEGERTRGRDLLVSADERRTRLEEIQSKPEFQRTAEERLLLKEGPVRASDDASEEMKRALAAMQKTPALRTQEERMAIRGVQQSPKQITVNIGLKVETGGTVTPAEARLALKAQGVKILEDAVHQSETEDTFVAVLSRPLTPDEADRVATITKQEAIAQYDENSGEGELYGPGAENWRPFNPEFFLDATGTRLVDTATFATRGLDNLPGDATQEEIEEAEGNLRRANYLVRQSPKKTAPTLKWVAHTTDENGAPILSMDNTALVDPVKFWGHEGGKTAFEYTVVQNNEPVGVTTLAWKNGKVTDLFNIYIESEFRKGGTATRVLETVLNHNDRTPIWINLIIPRAEVFWRRIGTKLIETEAGYDGELTLTRFNTAQRGRDRSTSQSRRTPGQGVERPLSESRPRPEETAGNEKAVASSGIRYSPKDDNSGVRLTRAQRLASSSGWLYGKMLPYAVTTQSELGSLLQEQATMYETARTEDTPENRKWVATVLEHEARLALKSGEHDALGWYDKMVDHARVAAGFVHPELLTDNDAWFAFTYALAVTSNGQTIQKNVEYAFDIYGKYHRTRNMPVMGFGITASAMKIAFQRWNDSTKSVGVGRWKKFLLSEHPVSELKKINRSMKELVGDTVYGGAVIGSKIGGGFLQNLHKNFDALTIDRWMMRTWGRTIGHLIGTNGALIDDPENSGNRHYIRSTMKLVLGNLQKDYPNLTMADLQALLWYEEKALYSMHEVNTEEPTDYVQKTTEYAVEKGVSRQAIDDAIAQLGEPARPNTTDQRGRTTETARGIQSSPKLAGEDRRDHSVDVTGVHFSTERRETLTGDFYGRGYRGAEAERLNAPGVDPRIRRRLYFYFNEGEGIHPEKYVGPHAHKLELTNLYDLSVDPLGLTRRRNENEFESAILDAGYSGYIVRGVGAGVLLGRDTYLTPEYLGTAPETYAAILEIPPAEYNEGLQLALAIANNKNLPSGEMTGAEWQALVPEATDLLPEKKYYKSQVASSVRWSPKNVTQTPEFKRWFGASKVVDTEGKPLVVSHWSPSKFNIFSRTTDLGYHFGTQAAAEDRAASVTENDPKPGTIRQFFLAIRNPLELDDTFDSGVTSAQDTLQQLRAMGEIGLEDYERVLAISREDALVSPALVWGEVRALITDAGYDGVTYSNGSEDEGEMSWIAFQPEQIKLTSNKSPTENPDIRYSPKIIGDSLENYTPTQRAMLVRIGIEVEEKSIREKITSLRKNFWARARQGLFDQFDPIKSLSPTAYLQARLSKGTAGALEVLLRHGKLKLTGNVFDGDTSGGFVTKVLVPLHGETTRFLVWVAGNRAEQLTREDRENLFTAADIAAAKSLAAGQTTYDYLLPNGTTTRNRAAIFTDSVKKYDAFNRNVLDMAAQSGLIDQTTRPLWEKMMYVPFFRVMEGGFAQGGSINSGLVRQQGIRMLKGGGEKLNSDLLANVLQNWFHLIDASAKNRAAASSVQAAATLGLALEADPTTAAEMAKTIGSNMVWYLDQGIKRAYVLEKTDEARMLYTAITSLDYAGLRGPIMDGLSFFKHALTVGVTASPFFKVRNLIRDSVQAAATANISYNLAGNVVMGFQATGRERQDYVSMVASGGLIRFGTMLEGREADRVRQLTKEGIAAGTLLTDQGKLDAVLTKMKQAIEAYNELGNRGEEINRAALYKQLTAKGMNHAEAALAARDLLDFSMQGAWTSVRFLTQVVPFMNARLQGIYKLGRATAEDKSRMAIMLGAVSLTSLSLLAAFHDDDDWKRRTDADRNNWWWFKLFGTAFRIPKPFEVGAIATLAERGAELFFDHEMTGERFGRNIWDLIDSQLSMNPIPQAVKPLIDLYANRNSFTGAPIESMGMERLQPEYRYTSRTSMAARAVSTAGAAVSGIVGAHFLSPVQLDHMVNAYFAWLGTFVVGASDILARPLTDEPARPAGDSWKLATGGMIRTLPENQSRYVDQIYKQAEVLEQAYGTYRDLIKRGRAPEAQAFALSEREKLAAYRGVEVAKRAESTLNERIRMIENSRSLSPEDKRIRIQEIASLKDRVGRTLALH